MRMRIIRAARMVLASTLAAIAGAGRYADYVSAASSNDILFDAASNGTWATASSGLTELREHRD